jgi:hypothetical protein
MNKVNNVLDMNYSRMLLLTTPELSMPALADGLFVAPPKQQTPCYVLVRPTVMLATI